MDAHFLPVRFYEGFLAEKRTIPVPVVLYFVVVWLRVIFWFGLCCPDCGEIVIDVEHTCGSGGNSRAVY